MESQNVAILQGYRTYDYIFYCFIKSKISQGRYNNTSEVIRAVLRLLEENEQQAAQLSAAIDKGLESGKSENYEPTSFLQSLKARRNG